jgi:hypothetical protein
MEAAFTVEQDFSRERLTCPSSGAELAETRGSAGLTSAEVAVVAGVSRA